MDVLTPFLVIALIVEPFLVLWVAPRLTQGRVHRDAVKIIDNELIPKVQKMTEAKLKELATYLTEQVPASDAASTLGLRSGDSRIAYAAREEQVEAAIMQLGGPTAAVLAEQAREMFPKTWKALVRAGPEGVPAFLEKAKGLTGQGQQGGNHPHSWV